MSATDRWYDLRNSAYDREFAVADSLLADDPTLLHARDGLGETVLHFLAVEDDLEGVAWLHSRGAALNTKNTFGTPALFEVAQLGYQSLFGWLIDHGADIRAKDSHGRGIVEYLQEFEKHDMVAFVRQYGG